MKEETKHHCLNCGRTEHEIPLVNLTYAGKAAWICSQCLPVLIHHMETLQEKLDKEDQE
jgi:hypothetical protein